MKLEIENSVVLRDGAIIGAIHEGTCYSDTAIPGVVKGKVRDLANNPKLKFVVGAVPEDGDDTPESAQPQTAKPKKDASVAPQSIADLLKLAEDGTIPQPPTMRPDAGDKTPAFVEWVRNHTSPDVFTGIYQGRKLPRTDADIDTGAEAHRRRLKFEEENPQSM